MRKRCSRTEDITRVTVGQHVQREGLRHRDIGFSQPIRHHNCDWMKFVYSTRRDSSCTDVWIIARQHARHAERDIVLPSLSVRQSVRLSNADTESKRMDMSLPMHISLSLSLSLSLSDQSVPAVAQFVSNEKPSFASWRSRYTSEHTHAAARLTVRNVNRFTYKTYSFSSQKIRP